MISYYNICLKILVTTLYDTTAGDKLQIHFFGNQEELIKFIKPRENHLAV